MKKDKIEKILPTLISNLAPCQLCPHQCGVNRLEGETGFCRTGDFARVSSYGPHFGEEPPLSGRGGSGTIFFSNCNMGCCYCQNYEISQQGRGESVHPKQLAGMMLSLSKWGCHNINLVSPTHVLPFILEALLIAAEQGLDLPVVYNTGGYERPEIIDLLEGIVDIYMPDMKYGNSENGLIYSKVADYPYYNQKAVARMFSQVGDLKIDGDGIASKGLLVRHLILPNQIAGSEEVFRFIADKISPVTYVNIMDQYHPVYKAVADPDINRHITPPEFQQAVNLAKQSGLKNIMGL
ncbi:MAG: radical SAM protein [bacterium]